MPDSPLILFALFFARFCFAAVEETNPVLRPIFWPFFSRCILPPIFDVHIKRKNATSTSIDYSRKTVLISICKNSPSMTVARSSWITGKHEHHVFLTMVHQSRTSPINCGSNRKSSANKGLAILTLGALIWRTIAERLDTLCKVCALQSWLNARCLLAHFTIVAEMCSGLPFQVMEVMRMTWCQLVWLEEHNWSTRPVRNRPYAEFLSRLPDMNQVFVDRWSRKIEASRPFGFCC